jgi:hypothetical protein
LAVLAIGQIDDDFDSVKFFVNLELENSARFYKLGEAGPGDANANRFTYSVEAYDGTRDMLITVRKDTPERISEKWRELGKGLVTDGASAGFSDLPLGRKARRYRSDSEFYIQSIDTDYLVQTRIRFRHHTPDGEDYKAEEAFLEGVNRRLLARCSGQDYLNGVSHGGSMPDVLISHGDSGDILVDLTAVCKAFGINLVVDHLRGIAKFGDVVIPLAATRIKKDDKWIETPDISVILKGRWYVSLEALQAARRGTP